MFAHGLRTFKGIYTIVFVSNLVPLGLSGIKKTAQFRSCVQQRRGSSSFTCAQLEAHQALPPGLHRCHKERNFLDASEKCHLEGTWSRMSYRTTLRHTMPADLPQKKV
eukprot:scaffold77199_cov18-Tisochrysis_lutea.AAC.5